MGSKKKGARGKKEKKQKTATASKKGTKTGYQVFVAESMKQGSKMGEAASAWKLLDAAKQQEYKDKATQLSVAGAADEAIPSSKSKREAKDMPQTATKTKTGNPHSIFNPFKIPILTGNEVVFESQCNHFPACPYEHNRLSSICGGIDETRQ